MSSLSSPCRSLSRSVCGCVFCLLSFCLPSPPRLTASQLSFSAPCHPTLYALCLCLCLCHSAHLSLRHSAPLSDCGCVLLCLCPSARPVRLVHLLNCLLNCLFMPGVPHILRPLVVPWCTRWSSRGAPVGHPLVRPMVIPWFARWSFRGAPVGHPMVRPLIVRPALYRP